MEPTGARLLPTAKPNKIFHGSLWPMKGTELFQIFSTPPLRISAAVTPLMTPTGEWKSKLGIAPLSEDAFRGLKTLCVQMPSHRTTIPVMPPHIFLDTFHFPSGKSKTNYFGELQLSEVLLGDVLHHNQIPRLNLRFCGNFDTGSRRVPTLVKT